MDYWKQSWFWQVYKGVFYTTIDKFEPKYVIDF